MRGIKLTIEQKDILKIQKFDNVQYYNPVLDNNNEYFVSEQEVIQTINSETQWVKDEPLVDIELKVVSILD
jgi:hypothetical protein